LDVLVSYLQKQTITGTSALFCFFGRVGWLLAPANRVPAFFVSTSAAGVPLQPIDSNPINDLGFGACNDYSP
jgi:hypothetical protein